LLLEVAHSYHNSQVQVHNYGKSTTMANAGGMNHGVQSFIIGLTHPHINLTAYPSDKNIVPSTTPLELVL
jgi:hypothetical protein